MLSQLVGTPKKWFSLGVAKTEQEIEQALNAQIYCFNVESQPELDRISAVASRLAKVAPISLRINPDIDAGTHPYISTGLKENKFGIPIEKAQAAYKYASAVTKLKHCWGGLSYWFSVDRNFSVRRGY